MSINVKDLESLREGLQAQLRLLAKKHSLSLLATDPAAQLSELIGQLYLNTGKQVVVLVDEYDKPILDAIHDVNHADDIREVLYSFYTVLKASAAKLRLLLVTGITKISQTSIFSGFNNLNDISLDNRFASVCGYTQQELEVDFDEHIQQLATKKGLSKHEVLANIKHWYNGYSWDGKTFVYNPYSVLLLLDKGVYKAFWYSTGTPTFLLKLLKTDDNLENVMKDRIGVFDTFTDGQVIEKIGTMALLFQSGYLTIKNYKEDEHTYELGIPNEEVRVAISELVLSDLNNEDDAKLHKLSKNIREAFSAGDTAKAISNLDTLLANTTYNTHASNQNESHYQALFQLAMILSRIDHRGESLHRKGRTDAVLLFDRHVYVVEIKYAKDTEGLDAALADGMKQIQDNHYYKPFLNQNKQVRLLALAFTQGKAVYMEEVIPT